MAFLRDTSLFCIPNSTFLDNQKNIVGGICMATSTIGFLGAILQLKSLWQYRYRQRRWPSADHRIIFYLALSDMVACLGVLTLAICFVESKAPRDSVVNKTHAAKIPYDVSPLELFITIVESFTIFFYLASYLWTFSFALDMCFQIFRNECPMIVYHILAWIIPLELVAFIQGINYGLYPHGCELKPGQMSRLILSYMLVPVVIVGNSVLFWFTYKKIKKFSRAAGSFTNADRNALAKFKRKFFLMVFVFTICWLPNIFSVIHDIVEMSKIGNNEQYVGVPGTRRFSFIYIEAFLNPLQGVFNYIIYRKSFRVRAIDTHPTQNALPYVPVPDLSRFERPDTENAPPGISTRETVQRITGSSSTYCDEETQFLASSRSANTYTYISRLLGE